MQSISLKDTRLIWSPGGNRVIEWPLDEIRFAYLFLPQGFTWRIVLPSETTYRYLDLDQLDEQGFKDLLVQLFATCDSLGKHFHFVLKGPQGPALVTTFKELVEKNVDLMLVLRDTREVRLRRQTAWLNERPSASCHGVVFDLTGVHKGGNSCHWRDLDHVEITKVSSLVTVTAIAYVPVRGRSSRRTIQRISPEDAEECLAEIDFWRRRALPPEALDESKHRQTMAHDRSLAKQKKVLLILAAVVLGSVLLITLSSLLVAALMMAR
jgi:hypothetical protein